MNKFKNYSFLTGLISAVLMVIVQILSAFEIYISSETVSNIVSVMLGALVVLGVISKPENTTENKTEAGDNNINKDNIEPEQDKTDEDNQN